MIKKILLLAVLMPAINNSFAQTTFLPLWSEDNAVLDRLETRSGRLCDSLALGDRAESRRNAINFLEHIRGEDMTIKNGKVYQVNYSDSAAGADPMKTQVTGGTRPAQNISTIDLYNLQQMISESGEWAPDGDGAINSKHPWFHTFYTKQYDFGYVKTNNFYLVANPVTNNYALVQHNSPQPAGFSNTIYGSSRGAELRCRISKKLAFYTAITDNQEQYPYYVNNTVTKNHMAVPGGDYFLLPSKPSGAYDFMQASGYMNFDAVKDHVNVTFGSGKHFLGDGISSMFLTDYSSNMPFLQLQTRIWHINYECLYLELTPQYNKGLGDALVAHKFSTIHYLTWNATRWFNIGFFEAEVFDRPNVYEISYLNPIIFSTAVNRFNGEGDKSILGMSAKAILLKHVQLYGQLVFNEFKASELFGSKGWYGNKWGVQLGGKYFDAFGIKNLDVQAELDMVRPYTYSAQDTLANYTNYNQPLADPLGSGFIKSIGLIKYQPVKNLYLSLKATYYIQGVDTGGANFGNNVFEPYVTADHAYGVSMINGPKSHCEIVNLNLSYQLRRNLFIDIGGTYRKYVNNAGVYSNDYTTTGPVYGPLSTNYVYLGLRINAGRRDFDFF